MIQKHARQDEEEAATWLARLRVGDASDQDAFEAWYASDPCHADAYDRVLRTWELTGRADQNVDATVVPSHVKEGHRRWPTRLAIAALLVACLVGFGLLARVPGVPGMGAAYAFETRPGEIRSFRLADGSRVTLDTDSAIDAAFSSHERHVRLSRGRARFDIVNAGGRIFVIDAGAGTVEAARGILDVAMEDGRTTIALWRGDAMARSTTSREAGAALAHGSAVRIDQRAAPFLVRPVVPDDPRWVSGMLSFENVPVSKVVATANRYAATPIVIGDPEVGRQRFTGTFVARDTGALANTIAAMFDRSVSHDRDGRLRLDRHPD